jgi:hypothetical protein
MTHLTRAEWDALTPDARRALLLRGPAWVAPSIEQAAAYEARLRADETGWPRELQRRGEVTREEADAMVRAARVRRELRRRRNRRANR